jgi:hypothetical protein
VEGRNRTALDVDRSVLVAEAHGRRLEADEEVLAERLLDRQPGTDHVRHDRFVDADEELLVLDELPLLGVDDHLADALVLPRQQGATREVGRLLVGRAAAGEQSEEQQARNNRPRHRGHAWISVSSGWPRKRTRSGLRRRARICYGRSLDENLTQGDTMPNGRTRALLSTVCGTIGLLLIFIAVLIGYVRRSVFEERAFAGHVAASLKDPNVAEYAAEQIADAVIEVRPNLVGVRPLIVGVAQSLVALAAVPLRGASRGAHAAPLDHERAGEGRRPHRQGRGRRVRERDVDAAQARLQDSAETLGHARQARFPAGRRAGRGSPAFRRDACGRWHSSSCSSASPCAPQASGSPTRSGARSSGLGVGLVILAFVLAIAARFGGSLLRLWVRDTDLALVLVGLARTFLSASWHGPSSLDSLAW